MHVDKVVSPATRMIGRRTVNADRLAPQSPRRTQGAGGSRPSCSPGWPQRRGIKLGLRAHLMIFGLAIVVPVLLYSASCCTATRSRCAPPTSGARCRSHARSAPTSIVRSPASSPRSRRWQPRRRMATTRFHELPRPGPGGLRSRRLERRADRQSRPAAGQYASADWGVTSPMSNLSEPDLPRIARADRQALRVGSFRRHRRPALDIRGRACRCARARRFNMRWSCRSIRSG